MEQIAISFEPQRITYTVSELSGRIRGLLAGEFTNVLVAGEISGCRTASSGHCYFTLKDEESQIQCVCFRGTMRYLRCKPQDGVAALVRGSIDVYEARGQYQLIADSIEPQGHGALQLAFEQLKKKLAAEGLFEASRKRPLPRLPARIGIVTSPGGAVIQDLLNILSRRFPGLHIRLYPAQVQGEGSVEQVCQGLEYFSRSQWAQVVIVARGGGSIEDLWTFNEEAIARAIAASAVPVISAIGHETDFTIADFVADLRAPTPSAAAELAVRTGQEILEQIAGAGHKLTHHVRYRLAMAARDLHQRGVERASAALHRRIGRVQQRVDELDYRMRGVIQRGLDARRRRLEEQAARLRGLDLRVRFGEVRRRLHMAEGAAVHAWQTRAALAGRRLETLTAQLSQLSPLRVLERGYAIVLNESGAVVKQAGDAPPNSTVEIRAAHARLRAIVTTTLLMLLMAFATACDSADIGPHLTTTIALQRTGAGATLIKVHVKNESDHATVPLDIEVTTAPGSPAMHPVPFVLNHGEVRDLQTSLATSSAVRATLIVKEAERGVIVVTKSAALE